MTVSPLTLSDLLALADEQRSQNDLAAYFAETPAADGTPTFSGRWFERLGGGGDRPEVCEVITTDDLVAVQMLSEVVPRYVALDLLEGELGAAVTAELEQIPTDVDLGTDRASALIADGGHADRAWQLLKEPYGMGSVIAGKLLARKRPRLVPVYDQIVKCALGQPEHFWSWTQDQFSGQDRALPMRLEAVRDAVGLPPAAVALPRVLDVILWIRHKGSHTSGSCARAEFTQFDGGQKDHVSRQDRR